MDNLQEKIRVFFSFHVPDDVGVRLLSDLKNIPGLAPYPPENLHITLKFVGEVSSADIATLAAIGSEIAEAIPPISVAGHRFVLADERLRLELVPNRFLTDLYRACTERLLRQKIGKIDSRPYAQHITLGRPDTSFGLDRISTDASQYAFTVGEMGLYRSEPGPGGVGHYTLLQSFPLRGHTRPSVRFSKIILPTRPQPDTIVAIFLLKQFGEDMFPGIGEAKAESWQVVPDGTDAEELEQEGILLLDLGGGRFDHHGRQEKTTASDLVSEVLGVRDESAIKKLIEYARRDDFHGKGTISNDPLDRAFGLSGLIAVLNKTHVGKSTKVVELVLPFLEAHYREEVRRTEELPQEFEAKQKAGEVDVFDVKQRDKKLSVVVLTSGNASLPGYLRSQQGGKYDVVAQWLPSNHVNILTRPTKRVDLRSLAVLLRMEEATRAGVHFDTNPNDFARQGRMPEIPEWFYDPATNSIQNGGLTPKEIQPTKISKFDFRKILELGLSEKLWDPRG